MGFVVLHLDKSSGNEASMTAHIERTAMPSNADPERTHLNKELIEFPEGVSNRTEAISHRLKNAKLERKIGKNQVQVIRVMLTGSHEDMKRIETEGKLGNWCNDNINWLKKTFGEDNIVSAVLHMDEATPHIHASVVPIVTGERRKVRDKQQAPEQQGKKKYKKKNPNASRLCADDVMTRDKLKEYQDTYAQAMNKYGLQRGIMGSEARHITTQQFYRDAIANQQNLQENIELLLCTEEIKRQSIDELKQREQEAKDRFKQAETLKQQKESELGETQVALKQVKGQLKTEKLKNTAADVGSTIIEGIGSMIGTSKVKIQQQEIDKLKIAKDNLIHDIKALNQNIQTMQKEHETITDKLKQELKKIYDLFPFIKELLQIERLLKVLNFSENMIKDILKMKPVGFKGKVYSPEYQRYFETEYSVAEVKPHSAEPNKLQLTIDGVSEGSWFRQKYRQFQESIGIKQKPKSCNKIKF